MKILIVVVCILAIGATALTILIGERSFDGLVVEKPYETGLAWDKTEHQKNSLGWRVTIAPRPLSVGSNDLQIQVVDRAGVRLPDADVSVKLTRPETAAYDRGYRAVHESDGAYHAAIMLPAPGNWQAVVAVAHLKDQAIYTIPVYASGASREEHH